jgi:type IV pilus assembly protein PilO
MRINLKNAATQKWIIGCTVTFGLIYGYTNFIYVPRAEHAKKLNADIKKESELLVKGKRIAANFQTVEDDYGRLMQSWDIAHELLPTQREMEGLLKSITLEGQSRDVSFLLFKPLDPIERPFYWENPIQIKTLSNYHDLGDFLSAVASMDRIVNINNLHLQSYKPNKGHSEHTVQAEFTASIYIFKELGSAVPAEATDSGDPAQAKPKPGDAPDNGKPAAKPAKAAPAGKGHSA